MEDDYLKYKLNDESHNDILKDIQEYCFDGCIPTENPEIVILGGQPGAGKGKLIEISMKEICNPVIINGDEFRKFHPQSDEIFMNHKEDYAKYTDPDVREWTREVFDSAIENSYNIVFEGTMRTNQICNTIKVLKEKGYKINIKVVAVNEFDSRLGIFQRYEKQLRLLGNGRLSPRSIHDEAYGAMLIVLDQIEREKLFDTLQVYSRDGQVIYQNNGNNEKLEACKAIIKEREKEWDPKTKGIFIKHVNQIIDSMEFRHEKNDILKEVLNLKDEALTMLNKRKDKNI